MQHLSHVMPKEIMQATRPTGLSLTAPSVEEMKSLVILLGEHQSYDDIKVRSKCSLWFQAFGQ